MFILRLAMNPPLFFDGITRLFSVFEKELYISEAIIQYKIVT